MGGLGSDAAIETADTVIQNDQPSNITTAIQVGKLTSRVVWQNIIIAMIVKVNLLLLGAGGLANLLEAVIGVPECGKGSENEAVKHYVQKREALAK